MNLTETFTSIANAIRGKTGKEDKITPAQMAEEIEGIEVGGNDTDYATLVDGTMVDFVAPDEATKIKQYLFYKNETIKTANTNNATAIETYAFSGSTLQSVDMQNKVTTIGASAFSGSALETITNSDSVTSIGNSAFNSCTQLREFKSNMDVSISSASLRVFLGCTNLKEVIAPKLSLNNAMYIFQDCPSLEKVDVIGYLIGASSFLNCESLTTLIIRQWRKQIATLGGVSAFRNTPIESGTGYIYVPKDSIEQYKVATNWINFADQFRAIEDYPEICGGAENG